MPSGNDGVGGAAGTDSRNDRSGAPPGRATGILITASFLVGISSVAVWTFGGELITVEGDASGHLSSVMWTVIGAAGIAGALSGPLVQRIGIPASWMSLMVALAAASAGLAIAPSNTGIITVGAVIFGATYIALTGVALLWAT